MTESELLEIESRANAATPGPWVREAEHFIVAEKGGTVAAFGYARDEKGKAQLGENLTFCVNARADIPALIAEVRRLRAELDKTVLDGLNVQALVARVEELEAEAAKSRRVFVWEFPWKDSNNVLRICWSKSLRFYLTMSDSCLELIDALTGDPFDCYDIHGVDKIGLAEQLIRELGFARDGDVFDRSKVGQ